MNFTNVYSIYKKNVKWQERVENKLKPLKNLIEKHNSSKQTEAINLLRIKNSNLLSIQYDLNKHKKAIKFIASLNDIHAQN